MLVEEFHALILARFIQEDFAILIPGFGFFGRAGNCRQDAVLALRLAKQLDQLLPIEALFHHQFIDHHCGGRVCAIVVSRAGQCRPQTGQYNKNFQARRPGS